MNRFCKDRDILAVEPAIFLGGGFASQQLAAGTDGEISGTTFTSGGSDFEASGVEAGMVLSTYTTSPPEGNASEIVSVAGPTSLTLSALRADETSPPVAPPSGASLGFRVRTFQPQIKAVSDTLAEKLRQLAEVAGISAADFADSSQLTAACAYGVLASVFVARAENAVPTDANWIKSEHYRREFGRMQLQLRLAVDADGDGRAEQTRTLGNITLRRV